MYHLLGDSYYWLYIFCPASSYDDYGFSRGYLGLEKDVIDPLVVKARKLDHKARSAESALDVSLLPRGGGANFCRACWGWGCHLQGLIAI